MQLTRFVPHRIGLRGVQSWQQRNNMAIPLEVRVLDPWIPSAKPPTMFSKEGRLYYKNYILKRMTALISVMMLKWTSKTSLKEFKSQTGTLYEKFNAYYSSANREELQKLTTDAYFSRLNPEIKHFSKAGAYKWKFHCHVDQPRIAHVRFAKAQLDVNGPEQHLCQVTVKFHTRQSIGFYNKGGRLVGGDPDTPKEVYEHLVFERNFSIPDSKWRIASKIEDLSTGQEKK